VSATLPLSGAPGVFHTRSALDASSAARRVGRDDEPQALEGADCSVEDDERTRMVSFLGRDPSR